MSRTIRLTRIHALNWYGYKDSIPVEGNLLLAGITGSGKSILMDLVQIVLVGDQRLVRFNQSATGDRSGATRTRWVHSISCPSLAGRLPDGSLPVQRGPGARVSRGQANAQTICGELAQDEGAATAPPRTARPPDSLLAASATPF